MSNTIRWCWPHRWSHWEFVGIFGFEKYQGRKCQRCGKAQQKPFGWEINPPAKEATKHE